MEGFFGDVKRLGIAFRWVNFLVFDFGELGVVGIRCNSFIWSGANQHYWLGASYFAGLRYPLRLRMLRPF